MNKKFLYTATCLFCVFGFAAAQGNSFENVIKQKDSLLREEQKTVYYTSAECKNFAHWSWGLQVGGAYFDGNDYELTGSPRVKIYPTAGIELAYSFNPIVGMGWQYAFVPYGVNFKSSDYQLRGTSHELDMFLSVNVFNLFTRHRKQKWNLYADLGVGAAFYQANVKDGSTEISSKSGATLAVPLAVLLEYNINKNIAIGLKGESRYHATNKLKGYDGTNESVFPFDAFRTISFTFRHKIQGGKTRHVRNISYSNVEVVELAKKVTVLQTRVEKGKKDSVQLQKITEKIENAKEKRPDTVIVVKESERVVVEKVMEAKDKEVFKRAQRGIQFELGTAEISRVSLPLLTEIAKIMLDNPSYELDIVCHTDNTDSEKESLDLSIKRANNIKNILAKQAVPAARIASAGMGSYSPIASNNTPIGRSLNRRTEFVVRSGSQILYK